MKLYQEHFNELLQPQNFYKWLTSLSTDHRFGDPEDRYACPLYEYLSNMDDDFAGNSQISLEFIHYNVDGLNYSLPTWASTFQEVMCNYDADEPDEDNTFNYEFVFSSFLKTMFIYGEETFNVTKKD